MNKQFLLTKMKSTGIAYLCWFLLGFHYGYIGKWGIQLLFWITFGGLGIWAIIDLFRIPSLIDTYNLNISTQIEEIEKKEQDEAHARNLSLIAAAKGN